MYIQHSLMNDRVATSLANHEISPLNDNYGHKERRMTREFEHLALCVRLENDTTKRSQRKKPWFHVKIKLF